MKRKSRITQNNKSEPQIDNTRVVATPVPDTQVPGVVADHNAMVQ